MYYTDIASHRYTRKHTLGYRKMTKNLIATKCEPRKIFFSKKYEEITIQIYTLSTKALRTHTKYVGGVFYTNWKN